MTILYIVQRWERITVFESLEMLGLAGPAVSDKAKLTAPDFPKLSHYPRQGHDHPLEAPSCLYVPIVEGHLICKAFTNVTNDCVKD
jgi:hypothetical protein